MFFSNSDFYRPRFGLFSQPASNAIGDTNVYPNKVRNLDPDTGKPQTGPRNFYTKRMRGGKDEGVYFERGHYNCIGDPFKMAASTMVGRKGDFRKGGHDLDFKPAKNTREKLYKAIYEYMPLKEGAKDPKRCRDADGVVQVKEPNMKCNPLRKGQACNRGVLLGEKIPAMAAEYGIDTVLEEQRRQLLQR